MCNKIKSIILALIHLKKYLYLKDKENLAHNSKNLRNELNKRFKNTPET